MGRGKSLAATSPKMDEDYRAEDDHRTMERAEEIRSDRGRMRGVAKHHVKKMREMACVGQRLNLANPERTSPKRLPLLGRARRGR